MLLLDELGGGGGKNTHCEATGPNSTHRNLTYDFFLSHRPSNKDTSRTFDIEQTQTFHHTPTGAKTSVRPRDDHTGK